MSAQPRTTQRPAAIILFAVGLACRDTANVSTAPAASERHITTNVTTSPAGRPRTDERRADRLRMVRRTLAARDVTDPRVLEAMRNVPRHWFVPDHLHDSAYIDRPLPIGHGQTISQPYIVALMTQALDIRSGDRVLEIGTGSGYQAAVLAELTDAVYTIEIVEPLARRTIDLLKTNGYDDIHCRIGDGHRGWPEAAPFDAIIVTCAPDDVPQPLVDQLAVGGRMCIPIGDARFGQDLVLLTKQPDGNLKRESIAPVRFVPMTGEAENQDD